MKKIIIILIIVSIVVLISPYLGYSYIYQQSDQLLKVQYSCTTGIKPGALYGVSFDNGTHTIDINSCEWEKNKPHIQTQYDAKLLESNGKEYLILYGIKNAAVTEMWYSEDANSLNLKLDTSDDGVISLTIPKGFFDYPEDNQGEVLMIIHNGEEIVSVDISDETNHIVHFDFTHPDPTIEVIGAFYP